MDPYTRETPSGGGYTPTGVPPGITAKQKRGPGPGWFRTSARGRYLTAAALIVLCALAVPMVTHAVAKQRTTVLVALHDLPPGHVIVSGDLGPVQAQAPAASAMAATNAGSLLGQSVSIQVPAGALLVPGDLGTFPPSGQTTVPVAVKPGQYPPDLRIGELVAVFPVVSATGTATAALVHAAATGQVTLIQAQPDSSDESVVVELQMSTTQAPVVAQAPGVVLVGLDAAGDAP
jgi:hypothetical protein